MTPSPPEARPQNEMSAALALARSTVDDYVGTTNQGALTLARALLHASELFEAQVVELRELQEALELAVRAFAEYAEPSPSGAAVKDFMEGFLMQAHYNVVRQEAVRP